MSLVKCRVHGCDNQVREGLRRPSYDRGVAGQELADGETCWRCRLRMAREEKKEERRRQREKNGPR